MAYSIDIVSVSTEPESVGNDEFVLKVKVRALVPRNLRLTCTLQSKDHKFMVGTGNSERLSTRISVADRQTPAGQKTHKLEARLKGPAAAVDASVRVSVVGDTADYSQRDVTLSK